jgi:hypothetical protein
MVETHNRSEDTAALMLSLARLRAEVQICMITATQARDAALAAEIAASRAREAAEG